MCLPDTVSVPPTGTSTTDTPSTRTPTGTTTSPEPRVLEVCGTGAPFRQVQDAVDEARDGDTIEICPGVYEHVEIVNKDLTLHGSARNDVVIDGGLFYAAVYVEFSEVTLDNVTLTGAPRSKFAAGTELDLRRGASVTVTNAKLVGQDVPGAHFNAISVTSSDLTMDQVLVIDHPYGAKLATDQSTVTITHSVWRDNGSVQGVGVWQLGNSGFDIHNNLVVGNDGVTIDVAGGVLGATQEFYNNTIALNSSVDYVMYANTFVDFAPSYSSNIIAHNDAPRGFGASDEDIDLRYSTVFGATLAAYSPAGTQGVGSIVADPLFVDPDNLDFHLRAGSPCIDAGDPLAGANDVDGSRNDMGAFGGPDGDWVPPEP